MQVENFMQVQTPLVQLSSLTPDQTFVIPASPDVVCLKTNVPTGVPGVVGIPFVQLADGVLASSDDTLVMPVPYEATRI